MRVSTVVLTVFVIYHSVVAPPVTEKKKKEEGSENDIDSQVFDVEYKRYLHEVVQVLENDSDFRQRLEKADPEDIKNGKIAKELEFVNHNVRSKLDELKRQELERLRHLAMQQYEHENGIDRKHIKIPMHVDPNNPHTFEAEDLRKLIVQTTQELENADVKRKEEFKEYEMQKELQYQEQLKQLDEQNRVAAQKQHEEQLQKHKQHPQLHHPGSKQQFEQVWEEQDHLSPEDFNPKTFFHLHDLDGNGVWDANEVKTLFKKELDKMYDPNAPEDDIRERYEESERMREHVFNETDTNRDQLISYQEFLEQTKKQDFQRDEGWDPIDQAPVYTPDEYRNYQQQHEEEIRRMIQQGLVPPPGAHPNAVPQGYHPQGAQYHPNAISQQEGQYHPNQIPQQQQQYQQYQQPQYQQQQQHQPPVQAQAHSTDNQQQHQQYQQQQYQQPNQQQQQQVHQAGASQQQVVNSPPVAAQPPPAQHQVNVAAAPQQPQGQGQQYQNQPPHPQQQQAPAAAASSTH